jgi:hypothetical protein
MHKRTYSPDEVEAIVSLATRMQAEHQEQATFEEIERAAAEFGVESRFVHLAVQKLDASTMPSLPPESEAAWMPFKCMLILYVLTLLPTVAMVIGVTVLGGWFWPAVSAFFLFGVGLTFPVIKPVRLAFVPIYTTAAVAVIASLLVVAGVVTRTYWNSWSSDLAIITFIEVVIAMVGFGLARLVEHLAKQDPSRRGISRGS